MSSVIEKLKEREAKKNHFDIIYDKKIIIKNDVLEILERSITLNEPQVNLLDKKDGVYYTLLMLDPDAPYGYLNSDEFIPVTPNTSYGCTIGDTNISYGCNPNDNGELYGSINKNSELFINKYQNDPRNKTFLHWWISNIIYENGKLKGAEEWVSYYPPTPPKGRHRYYFYLFEQNNYNTKNELEINDDIRIPVYYEIIKKKFSLKLLQCKGFIVSSPEAL